VSFPKLSMRDVRKHPAFILNPAELKPEMGVALGYLLPTIGKGTRCAQALIGMAFLQEDIGSRREGFMHGFRHTPTWGFMIDDVATVNWVNTTNHVYENPYASFKVTQTGRYLPLSEKLLHIANSMDEVAVNISELPRVESYDFANNRPTHELEAIIGFEDLGLAHNRYGLDKFVIDLSKLGSNSPSTEPVHQ
jgi:hypothetical protein